MTTSHVPIAIIGAGLGGLVAARVLHTRGLEAAIFELEPDRHARVQGGMLDIHDDTGQQAIRDAGLWEGFSAIIHRGGEAMRILDHTGRVLRDDKDSGELSRPEVDRGRLRDLLIDSLPDDTIRWGHKLTAVRPVPGAPGRWELDLDGRPSVTTDLLVGADGAWSRIRPLLTDAWPAYSGISFVEADLFEADDRHPAEAAAMGDGMLFAFGGQRGILGHKEPDGSLHVYLGLRVAEDWADTIDFTDDSAAKQAVLDLLPGWDDALRGLIGHADTSLTLRRINALAPGTTWERMPGVTLVGDAAHLMSPFAGEGANLALYDGAQFALAVAKQPGDIEQALTEYEASLFPRSSITAQDSADSLEMLFNDESPKALVEMFARFDEQDEAERANGQPNETPTTRA